MNKRWTLACALALCGSAWAQTAATPTSRVTIYGVLDLNLEHVNNLSTVTPRDPGFPGDARSVTRMMSGGLTGSQLGFSGVEDLGGGNKAVFVLESGIDLRNGAFLQGGRGYGRQAFVGFESPYGKVTLGRQYTSIFETLYSFSPTVYATQYEPIIFLAGMNFRSDNTIKYTGKFGPVQVLAHWTFKSGVFGIQPDKPEEPFRRDSGFGAALSYTDGPWSATLAMDQANPVMALFGDKGYGKTQKVVAAVSHRMGSVKLIGGARWERGRFSDGQVFVRDNLWWAGVNYQPNAQWTLTGAYYHLDLSKLKRNLAAETSNPTNPWQVSVIANYAFSKRTSLYLSAAHSRHAGLNFDLSPIGYANAYYLGAGKTGMTGVAIGMRHRF